MNDGATTRVLFVCLGNICRSPTAHAVFESLLEQHGLRSTVEVDSCGTGDWHVGQPPDRRATVEARKRGYDLSPLRARQVAPDDFHRFHYILARDRMNLADLQALCPDDFGGHLGLFLPFARQRDIDEVPDPYYGGDEGFARVLDLIEQASEGLLREIGRAHATR
ncbi:MAG: low molecular weight protein-tyrosine-phosphatase [Synechococcaceae cyanobacterium]|nr:low molecular weight protein-tyrosine-phosphatase [Synechococcaceae cyanobacterium]